MRTCPDCRTPLLGDEIFCLQCGTRLVAEPAPAPPSWKLPALIVAAIAALAVGGVVFAVEQVESDAEREATKPARVLEQRTPGGGGERPREVASWPAGDSAHTVVIGVEPDETAARQRAAAAVSGGVPAGVLDSDDYPTLEPGTWVVFAGRFESRADAEAEAARYAGAGFPEARAQLVAPDERASR